MKRFIRESVRYGKILIGSFVYAVGIGLFLNPNNLAPGGVTGISIMLSRFTKIEVGTWSFLINIPILIIGFIMLGHKMIISTIVAVVMSSIWMNILGGFMPVTTEPLLAAIAGGICVATGIALAFKAGGTTGGMDVLIRCVRKKCAYVKTGILFLISDFTVITFSAVVFKNFDVAMYAGISAVIASYFLDLLLYGHDEAKMLFVISEKEKEIVQRILMELDIGVTELSGYGAYTGNEKKIILCVMRKPRMPKVRKIVEEIDDKAFMIISSASEIYGEGYKNYHVNLY